MKKKEMKSFCTCIAIFDMISMVLVQISYIFFYIWWHLQSVILNFCICYIYIYCYCMKLECVIISGCPRSYKCHTIFFCPQRGFSSPKKMLERPFSVYLETQILKILPSVPTTESLT